MADLSLTAKYGSQSYPFNLSKNNTAVTLKTANRIAEENITVNFSIDNSYYYDYLDYENLDSRIREYAHEMVLSGNEEIEVATNSFIIDTTTDSINSNTHTLSIS